MDPQQNRFLGESKISTLMLKFSIPRVLSLMVGALYNIVDQIFIGNSELSTLGNAAAGVAFPVFILAQACAWCIGGGCSTYLNICQGKNDHGSAHKAIGTGISLTVMISLLIMALMFPLKRPFLLLFGASPANMDLAVNYINIILAFMPTLLLSNMLTGIIGADGSPGFSMLAMLSGAAVNMILDPIFIFACHWGMTGAALATVLGQITTCLVALFYYLKPKTFRLHLKSFIPDWKMARTVTRLGSSTFVTQITTLIITVLCNSALVRYGALSHYGADIPIAVMGIATKVFTIVVNIAVGIVLGCQPIISYNMGAGKYDRLKKLYRSILLCTVTVGAAFTLLFELSPGTVIGLFGTPTNIPNPEDYWDFADKTFRIYLMLMTFNCVVKVNSIFFQASGKPGLALISSVIRDLLCFAPLILILPRFMGIDGVLVAAPIADFVSIVAAVIFTIVFMRSLGTGKRQRATAD